MGQIENDLSKTRLLHVEILSTVCVSFEFSGMFMG